MVAEREPQPPRRAERANLAAGVRQRPEEVAGRPSQPKASYSTRTRTPRARAASSSRSSEAAGSPGPHDVAFQADGFPRRGHQLQHGGKGAVAVGEPAGAMPVQGAKRRIGGSHGGQRDQKKMPRQAGALRSGLTRGGSKVRQGIVSVQPGPVEYPDLLRLQDPCCRPAPARVPAPPPADSADVSARRFHSTRRPAPRWANRR